MGKFLDESGVAELWALVKARSLTDKTAAMFGFGADAEPDDVFAFLGAYNQHWWRRRRNVRLEQRAEIADAYVHHLSANNTRTISYSKTITIDPYTGELALGEPITSLTTNHNSTHIANANAVLPGSYFTNSYTDDLYYVNEDAVAYYSKDDSYYNVFIPAQVVSVAHELGEWEELCSSDGNAYPTGGIVDGFEYQYFGIPFEKLRYGGSVVFGSYVGTGTYGSENPCSLSFEFEPKLLLMLYGNSTLYFGVSTTARSVLSLENIPVSLTSGYGWGASMASNTNWAGKSEDKKTVFWAYRDSAVGQFNAAGKTYRYVAFG